MLLNKAQFWFSEVIESGFEIFIRELAALPNDAFDLYPVADAYSGTWSIYPLIGTRPPEGYSVDLEANRALCPESFALLKDVPKIQQAAFSRLDPGTRIYPHQDHRIPRNIRCHLGLITPPEAELTVGGTAHQWKSGKLLLFDGQIEHSAKNGADEPRVVLLIDMELTPVECSIAGIS